MSLRLATAPVTWGVWERTVERDDLVPPADLLAAATSLGYGTAMLLTVALVVFAFAALTVRLIRRRVET